MIILVLPISGDRFPVQLGILQILCRTGFHPTITLGTSGGNLSAYIASAGNWTANGIKRVVRDVHSNILMKRWSPSSFVAGIVGFFSGTFYNSGIGSYDLLSKYFTSSTIISDEIWTGLYCRDTKRSRVFCNKSKDTTILNSELNTEIMQSHEATFCNGNIELISKVCVASASIPAIVPSVLIEDYEYIDGGVGAASPLTVLSSSILELNHKILHFYYVNSIDLSTDIKSGIGYTATARKGTLISNTRQTFEEFVRSQTIIDRYTAYLIVKSVANSREIKHTKFSCNFESVSKLRDKLQYTPSALIEFFPGKCVNVNLTSFTGSDVLKVIEEGCEDYFCRIWWISTDKFSSWD